MIHDEIESQNSPSSLNSKELVKKLSWRYRMPENCDPIEIFLMNLKAKIEMVERLNHESGNKHRHQFHIMLDAREVNRISAGVRMKMDSFCKTYLKRIENSISYVTILVSSEEQRKKMDKLYGNSGIEQYEIILPNDVVQSDLGGDFDVKV